MNNSPFLNDDLFFKSHTLTEQGQLLKSKKIWVPPSGGRKGYYRMDPRNKHEKEKEDKDKSKNVSFKEKEKEFIEQAIKDVAEDNSWDVRFDDNEFQNWNTDEIISKNEFIKKYEDEITGRAEVLMGEWTKEETKKKFIEQYNDSDSVYRVSKEQDGINPGFIQIESKKMGPKKIIKVDDLSTYGIKKK